MATVHRNNVAGYPGSMEELAAALGDLRYDALRQLLVLLAAKVAGDADKDEARGRRRLAALLRDAAAHLERTAGAIDRAWAVCEPFMQDPGAE